LPRGGDGAQAFSGVVIERAFTDRVKPLWPVA
jgi:hypothetical protein